MKEQAYKIGYGAGINGQHHAPVMHLHKEMLTIELMKEFNKGFKKGYMEWMTKEIQKDLEG